MEEYHKVWRVDATIMTLEETEVNEDAPIEQWIPGFVDGVYYMYFTDRNKALDFFTELVNDRIKGLQTYLSTLTQPEL